ncbi:MAG: aldehyde ferredoxin oxidoreductase family protein [Thermoplasmata archaeon]|nr:aldehyde ferredoxin oxidoreductase family protein [Thermoplasmata archaeon]
MNGFWGKILEIDLSKKLSEIKDVNESIMRKFLGGVGLAAYYLYKEVPKNTDPLDEKNVLIISPGMLVSSGIPTASKTTFVSKSPQTGAFGRAVAGATIGPEIKKSGYDMVIIKGKAEKPSIVIIEDDKIKIEETDLWGLDTRETQKRLKEKYQGFATAAIGPAGENLLRISIIDCEERQAARTGLGAVMGSKKLKAIAIRGTKKVPEFDHKMMLEQIKKWVNIMKDHPASRDDMKYGTGEFYAWMNTQRGTFPSRNWQQGYFEKAFDNLKEGQLSGIDPYNWAQKYVTGYHPCPNCTKPCGHIFEVKTGKYAGTYVDGLEYETMYSLGGNLEIDDPEAVAYLSMLCDLYGMDTISAGVTISWAMEAIEKNILKGDLKFGDPDSVAKVLKDMAYKKGDLGKLLSDGVRNAYRSLGKGQEFALEIKGLEPPAYDIRGIKGMALAEAVSVRGACHLTAGVYGTELVGKWWKFEGVDRLSAKGKGFEVKVHEDLMSVYDALGVCKFSRHMFFLEGFIDIIKAYTGFDMSIGELAYIGERIYNVERSFNAREGFTRKDDYLPERVMKDPIPKGVSKGSYVKKEELENMLDEYYQARGWSADGIPTKVKLFELDLEDIANEIGVGH